ncbi:MAG: TonB-dependent receptor, partial [Chloroflexi bacterium]|nr:TonB-dependent receptor [Chloroflexota bacterium]
EYEDVILNVGLRYDYIDIDALDMVDPIKPDLSVNKSNNGLIPDGWVKTSPFSAVSPRIGLSFPVTDRTVFHAQYGKFIQQPDLNQSYIGYDAYASQLSSGLFDANMRGPGLRPTRTTQYELGFSQQIADFMSFDITAYYKDIKDLVQMGPVTVPSSSNSQFNSYYTRANVDFATTRGIEIAINMRRYERIAINGSMTFQDSKGTGSYPSSARGIVGSYVKAFAGQGPFTPKNISPLEFDRAFMSNLNIDYRFGDNDGPAILHNFGVNVLITYQAGRPFTLADPVLSSVSASGVSTAGSGDARDRVPGEPLGTSNMPAYFNVDLKVDKSFTIFDRLRATIYVTVLNLFNTLNVNNVYLYTGTNTDDGYLSNPLTYQQQLLSKGQTYIDIYNLAMARNGYTSDMRQVRLGIRLDY